jgi:hypothetical protein
LQDLDRLPDQRHTIVEPLAGILLGAFREAPPRRWRSLGASGRAIQNGTVPTVTVNPTCAGRRSFRREDVDIQFR